MSNLLAVPKHSKAVCEKFFGRHASGKAAQELFRTNPQEYREVRASAEAHGLIGPQAKTAWDYVAERYAAKNQPRTFSDDELRARREFSEDECRRLLTKSANEPGENLGQMKANDPAKFARFQTAARSFGLVKPSMVEVKDHRQKPAPQPAQQPDTTTYVQISDSLADKFHLEHGTKVPAERLSAMIAIASEAKAAKDENQ